MIPVPDAKRSLVSAESVEVHLGVTVTMQMGGHSGGLRFEDLVPDNPEGEFGHGRRLPVHNLNIVEHGEGVLLQFLPG